MEPLSHTARRRRSAPAEQSSCPLLAVGPKLAADQAVSVKRAVGRRDRQPGSVLDQLGPHRVSDREVRGIAGRSGIKPSGGLAGTNLSTPSEDMVVELRRQPEFVGVRLAPFLDQGRKHLLGPGLPAELRQDVEQVKLGEVPPGKFRMQTAEEQFPPDGREGGDPLNRVITTEMGEGIGPEPVLTLFCPVGVDAAALGVGDLGLELPPVGGHGGRI